MIIFFNIIIIVWAIAGNKEDIDEDYGEVDEDEAKDFAKEIGAIFITTSAKEPNGIYELFNRIKIKYLEKIPKDRFDFDIPGKYL